MSIDLSIFLLNQIFNCFESFRLFRFMPYCAIKMPLYFNGRLKESLRKTLILIAQSFYFKLIYNLAFFNDTEQNQCP